MNENDSYFHLGRHLKPRVRRCRRSITIVREEGWLLLEDLGDISLEAALKQAGRKTRCASLRQALEILVNLQLRGKEGFDPAWCFDTPMVHGPFCGSGSWAIRAGLICRAIWGSR